MSHKHSSPSFTFGCCWNKSVITSTANSHCWTAHRAHHDHRPLGVDKSIGHRHCQCLNHIECIHTSPSHSSSSTAAKSIVTTQFLIVCGKFFKHQKGRQRKKKTEINGEMANFKFGNSIANNLGSKSNHQKGQVNEKVHNHTLRAGTLCNHSGSSETQCNIGA